MLKIPEQVIYIVGQILEPEGEIVGAIRGIFNEGGLAKRGTAWSAKQALRDHAWRRGRDRLTEECDCQEI